MHASRTMAFDQGALCDMCEWSAVKHCVQTITGLIVVFLNSLLWVCVPHYGPWSRCIMRYVRMVCRQALCPNNHRAHSGFLEPSFMSMRPALWPLIKVHYEMCANVLPLQHCVQTIIRLMVVFFSSIGVLYLDRELMISIEDIYKDLT